MPSYFSGALLRRIRLEAGYTQTELAKRLEVTRETIGAIENERPRTIQSLEMELVRRWWRICSPRLSQSSNEDFGGHIKHFFRLR